jgi:hypothetical protein
MSVGVNERLIVERLTPESVLSGTLLIWLALYIVAPVQGVVPSNVLPYVVLGASFGAFFVGFAVFSRMPLRQTPLFVRPDAIRAFYTLCLVLGFAGLALRSVDWFVYRHIDISASFFENRDLLKKSGGAIAVLAAALTPFVLASTIFAVAANQFRQRLPYSWLTYCGAAYWVAMNFLIGSRSAMMFFICVVAVALLLLIPKLTRKHKLRIALLFAGLFAAYCIIFLYRMQQTGATIALVSQYSQFTQRVPLDRDYLKLLFSSNPRTALFLFSLSSSAQYYLHGMFEALYVIDVKHSNFDLGAYQFELIPKTLNSLFDIPYDAEALEKSAVEVGVYLTFVGPVYVDFSYGAPLFCMLVGAAASASRRAVVAGNILALPFYATMLVTVALIPVGNMLVGGVGLFNLVILFGLWWLGSAAWLARNSQL